MKKYQIIYADPPWSFSGGIRSSKKVGGKYQYYTPDTTVGDGQYKSVMRDIDICNIGIPLRSYLHDDATLFMWTTDAHLPLAIRVMESWGLPYKTVAFVWNKKENSGKQVCYYGKWTMKGTELCLLGSRGKANSLIQSHKVRGLVEAKRGKHSEKPQEVRDRIVDLMGDIPRLELFARQRVEGWDCWGNEVECDIDLLRQDNGGEMETKNSKVIMFNSNEAAQYRTNLSGWVSGNGHYWGEDERAARYDGCTHRPCEGCGKPTEKGWLVCEECRNVRDDARYKAMPKEEWNKEGMLYSDSDDKYFSSWEEVDDYCEGEEDEVDELRLIICEPQYLPLLAYDYGCDELAEDGELPDSVEQAIEDFNKVIKSVGAVSWMPGKKAAKRR